MILNFAQSISRIGLGCVTFGREIDQKTSFALMDYALTKGICLFDTAAAYGAGISETIIGAWMKQRSVDAASVLVATKVLPPYTSKSIENSVNQSLKRLGADSLQLLYLHHWDASVEKDETLVALDQVVCTGKVQRLGASNFTAQQLYDAIKRQESMGFTCFRFAQNVHNFAVSELTDEFLQICRANEVAVVTYSPLGAGFLTGKYQTDIPPDSRFARIPGHQPIYFQENAYKRLAHLHEVAARSGNDPARLALGWAFQQVCISSVLIGGRSKAHIDQAIDAFAFHSPEVLYELEKL